MSEIGTMSAELRTGSGKGAARAERREGRVPAVIYGGKQEPVKVSLSAQDVRHSLARTAFFSTLLDLKVDGKTQRVLPRDVQFHPVSDEPWHVDFLRVSAATQVTVNVPVNFIDDEECPGLKRGGVLTVVRYEVEVSCSADSIPPQFVISLAEFDIGDSVHISGVDLPEGVTPTITDRDFTIATISPPTVVAEEAAEAAAAEAAEGEEVPEGEEGPAAEEEAKEEG